MIDYAVVGSGIGGSSIAALLDAKGHETMLFEKEPYLGGCSSTFKHRGYLYNTGATTLAGYEDGDIVKSVFDEIGFTPGLIKTDPAITIIHNGKTTPRYSDLEKFLEVVETNYPHPKNREFWQLVYEIGDAFYQMHGHYYSNRSTLKKYFSMLSFLPMFIKFFRYLREDANSFIHTFFGEISEGYMSFLEAQIMIVAQAPSKEVNFFTAAISLGYTFKETHYVKGGFGKLFDEMTSNIQHTYKKTPVTKITKEDDHYIIHTKKEQFRAKNVILNSTVYDSKKIFEDPKITSYYKKYEPLNNYQSSFMLYMTIKGDRKYEHHYQLIRDSHYSHTISPSLFVSFSDQSDHDIAPKGHYSITASIHTDLRWWQDESTYKTQKEELEAQLVKSICDILDIESEQIITHFSATPKTFERYINRSQLGGNAITMKNFLPHLPSNDTPIDGLYHVGDTVYAAQGWPGVMLGVSNLKRLLNV